MTRGERKLPSVGPPALPSPSCSWRLSPFPCDRARPGETLPLPHPHPHPHHQPLCRPLPGPVFSASGTGGRPVPTGVFPYITVALVAHKRWARSPGSLQWPIGNSNIIVQCVETPRPLGIKMKKLLNKEDITWKFLLRLKKRPTSPHKPIHTKYPQHVKLGILPMPLRSVCFFFSHQGRLFHHLVTPDR